MILHAVSSTQPATRTGNTWGTEFDFQRLAQVDEVTAAYWVSTVLRPAHRTGHPVPMHDCPGCLFEAAS